MTGPEHYERAEDLVHDAAGVMNFEHGLYASMGTQERLQRRAAARRRADVMTLNAAGDLYREVGKGTATATCMNQKFGGPCDFTVRNVWPEQAGRRARAHTRETGHITQVAYRHTTEYRPGRTS